MKTLLYSFDPLKPRFYIIKLGFTGVYINFLISAQNHRLWVLTSTHNFCFEQTYKNYQNFPSESFLFLVVKFLIYSNRSVFVMRSSFCHLSIETTSLGEERAGLCFCRAFVCLHYENMPIQIY